MVFNFQQYFSHIVALSCIGRRNRRIRRKPHTCRVTNKRYHIMLYTSPWSRFELTPSVVIGTDCISSFKSNYHTITDTTAAYIGVKHIFVMWVTCGVSYKRKGLLSLPEHLGPSSVCDWVYIVHLSSFPCCVRFVVVGCFACICHVPCAPNVASISWLYILDCPFGFLYHLM
jgi:hypothetical protein